MEPDLHYSESVLEKLTHKHGVSRDEVLQCFLNRFGPPFEQRDGANATNPPTYWFVSYTNRERRLLVAYMERPEGGLTIKTAFPANSAQTARYHELCDRHERRR